MKFVAREKFLTCRSVLFRVIPWITSLHGRALQRFFLLLSKTIVQSQHTETKTTTHILPKIEYSISWLSLLPAPFIKVRVDKILRHPNSRKLGRSPALKYQSPGPIFQSTSSMNAPNPDISASKTIVAFRGKECGYHLTHIRNGSDQQLSTGTRPTEPATGGTGADINPDFLGTDINILTVSEDGGPGADSVGWLADPEFKRILGDLLRLIRPSHRKQPQNRQ